MNQQQKAEFRAIIYGNFGPLAVIFDPQTVPPTVADHAYDTLIALFESQTSLLVRYETELGTHQLLESILFLRSIIDHPFPQNRSTGCGGYYTVYTHLGTKIGTQLLRDGIDNENGFVYWYGSGAERTECHEEIGLLGLTAKQCNGERLLTKHDVIIELKFLIMEAYNDYLRKRIQLNALNTNEKKSLPPYPQLDFSPAQVTCPLTSKIFHTPVLLITYESGCTGPIEKEKALLLFNRSHPSQPPCCPITGKPIQGFVICTITQHLSDQFWEQYQSGSFAQEFFRFQPASSTLAKPDCFSIVERHDNPQNRLLQLIEVYRRTIRVLLPLIPFPISTYIPLSLRYPLSDSLGPRLRNTDSTAQLSSSLTTVNNILIRPTLRVQQLTTIMLSHLHYVHVFTNTIALILHRYFVSRSEIAQYSLESQNQHPDNHHSDDESNDNNDSNSPDLYG